MIEQEKEVILQLPDNIDTHKESRTVCIDMSIVGVIAHLWNNKVETFGCCSGHGKTRPSVVIEMRYTQEEIEGIKELLKVDHREWDVLQWRLTKV